MGVAAFASFVTDIGVHAIFLMPDSKCWLSVGTIVKAEKVFACHIRKKTKKISDAKITARKFAQWTEEVQEKVSLRIKLSTETSCVMTRLSPINYVCLNMLESCNEKTFDCLHARTGRNKN